MKKFIFTVILFLLQTINSYSMFRTPESARLYYWLYSPDLLGRSIGLIGTENPSGIIINPASNAFIQQYKIEFSYGIAPGLLSGYLNIDERFYGAKDLFWPFIINSGCTIPTKYGNFTIYFNYMNMSNLGFNLTSNNDMGIGKIGSFYFCFSKDYSDEIALGLSANLKIGFNPLNKPDMENPEKSFDVSGGIDIGFSYKPEWSFSFFENNTGWGFQDFQIGLVLKDLGKPFIYFPEESTNDFHWFPNPFSLGCGIGFNLFNDGATYWKILSDISFPFFQNFTFSFGTEIQIFKFLILKTSYTFDLEGVLEYIDYYHYDIPNFTPYEYIYNIANASFGISFRFRSDFLKKQTKEEEYKSRHKTTSFSIDLGFHPYHQGFIFQAGCVITIGIKDKIPPEINFLQHDVFISPNYDGVKDESIVELSIKDERYISYWKMEIYDKNKKTIRIIESKENRKERMKFVDIIRKFFLPKTSVYVPKQIIWDGKDSNGNLMPDGEYRFKFTASDDNKNTGISKEGVIIIDTDKPEIKSDIINKIFSPNDDGNKDKLIIELDIIKNSVKNINVPVPVDNSSDQTIKIENSQKWFVDILDSNDKLIKRYTFNEKGKISIEWDGHDDNNNKVSDGVYKIKLYSTDDAGNYWEKIVSNIIIDTEPTPIEVSLIDKYFSPNNDKIKDNMEFNLKISNLKKIEKWSFEIINNDNKTIRSYSGESIPDNNLLWNGQNNNNNLSDEGKYTGKLTVIYENGNSPYFFSPEFYLDNTPPKGKLNIPKKIFSPNSDGKNDEISISCESSEEDEWNGFIMDSNNKTIKTYSWKNFCPGIFNWDGKNNDNKLQPDGNYFFLVSSTDLAGNKFNSEKKEMIISTKDIPVFITFQLNSFSPNNDGIKDNQFFEIRVKEKEENKIINWELNIYNDRDKKVFNYFSEKEIPDNFSWNGKIIENQILSDGFYYVMLSVNLESGITSSSKTKLFSIDTTKPMIDILTSSLMFSPNNDGFLDNLEILQKGSNEDLWEEYIYSDDGKNIWNKSYKGIPVKKEIWNGKDSNGNIQKNGRYKYLIKSTDEAGNTGEKFIDEIELKNFHTNVFITMMDDKFSPNNDGKFDTINFNQILNHNQDIDIYKIEIIDDKNNIIKSFQGKDSVPKEIIWDGFDKDNNRVPDGVYYLKLSIIYKFGNRLSAESSRFKLDTIPPDISLIYNPQYFSPDNDGIDDELSIFIKAEDLTGIKQWKLIILTPDKKKEFIIFNGSGQPSNKILWNGSGLDNQLVESAEDYPVKIIAEDEVGNILDKNELPVMVDILVIKLPDGRLKIKISNIEFKPNIAEMTDNQKNKKVLDLIAKALKKYIQYKIKVEGHANKFKEGLDEKSAKNLSLERAKTIVYELSKRGINIKRIEIIGKGFDEPLVPYSKDADEEELSKNRRVEFYLDKSN